MPIFPPRRRATSDPYREAAAAAAAAEANRYLVPAGLYGPMMVPQVSPHWAPVPLSPGMPYYGWPGQAYYPSPPQWPKDVEPPPLANITQLHPLLAGADPHHLRLLYDCRFKPDKSYIATTPPHQPYKIPDDIAASPATNPILPKMRLVSKAVPWAITVKNPEGVTVMDVLTAIYDALDQPLTEGEWWIAPESERARVLEAYKHNCSDDPSTPKKRKLEEGVRRIDWLGKKTMVFSVSRSPSDDALIKSRFPDKKAQTEAWVIGLGDV